MAELLLVESSHHKRSLADLGNGGRGSLVEALSLVFPLRMGGTVVNLDGVNFDPRPVWQSDATWRWVRPVEIVLASERASRRVVVHLDIPWSCDEDTPSDEAAGVVVGRHDGLFFGVPKVPLAQLAFRPGVHVLSRPLAASPDSRLVTRVVVVPDYGAFASLEARPAEAYAVWVEGYGRRVLKPTEIAAVQYGVASPRLTRAFASLFGLGGRAGLFYPSTLVSVASKLRVPEGPLGTCHLNAVFALSHESPPPLVDELGDRVLGVRCWGDLVRDAVVRSLVDAISAERGSYTTRPFGVETERDEDEAESGGEHVVPSRPSKSPEVLLASLRSRLERRWQTASRHLVEQMTVSDDDRNTLAWIERRRTVTRYGPRGVARPLRGYLWLRGIHPNRRGQLCPIQTPESEDIGLVRSLAVGASVDSRAGTIEASETTGGELSAAASLIPFLNHDDPARSSIGSKNLRQAVPIAGRTAPRILTGFERSLAEAGVARSPVAGHVAAIEHDVIWILGTNRVQVPVPYGWARPSVASVWSRWRLAIERGAIVSRGQLLAYAPDVVLDFEGTPQLALGTDVLVAYTPWHGYNYEDGIVVSEALVERFASEHVVDVTEILAARESADFAVTAGDTVRVEQPLAFIQTADDRDQALRTVVAPVEGTVIEIAEDSNHLRISLRVHRRLQVGDKLTNRHGGKGVVTVVLAEAEMPRLPDGPPVEMVLNPLGVLRRLNVGQMLEAHVSLRDYLVGDRPQRVVGRRASYRDQAIWRADLKRKRAVGGRLVLTNPDGSTLGALHGGVVVGWQYMIKLDHLAANKVRFRGRGPVSPRDGQTGQGSGLGRWAQHRWIPTPGGDGNVGTAGY